MSGNPSPQPPTDLTQLLLGVLAYSNAADLTQAILTDYQSPSAEGLTLSDATSVLTPASPFTYDSGYPAVPLADAPTFLWRLADAGIVDTSVADASPHGAGGVAYNGGAFGGVMQGSVLGPILPDRSAGTRFDGASGFIFGNASYVNPQVFTLEAWFATTTTAGGRLAGFGSSQTGTSASTDRHIYLTNAGALIFGCFNGGYVTLSAGGPYNDGAWHYVASTLSGAGMTLYVDGAQAATNANTAAQSYTGYWRVAYDALGGWPSAPTSPYFGGSSADVAVYPSALTTTRLDAHYAARRGTYWGGAQYV